MILLNHLKKLNNIQCINNKLFFLLGFLFILIVSISSVSAGEYDTSQSVYNIEENNNEVIATETGSMTFTELQNLVNSANNTLSLNKNVTKVGGELYDGVVINKTLKLMEMATQ